MNNSTTQTQDFILRRLQEPFPLDEVPRYLMYLAVVLLLGAGITFALSQKSHQGAGMRFWAGVVGLCTFMAAIVYMMFLQVIPSSVVLYSLVALWGAVGVAVLMAGMTNTAWFSQLRGSLGYMMVLFICGELLLGVLTIIYLIVSNKGWSLTIMGKPGGVWFIVLIAIGAFVLPYIIVQYIRDIKYLNPIGMVVGSSLMVARVLVFLIIGFFFLLPALQSSEETKTNSKVIVLFDVSDSQTQTRDKVPPLGVALLDMPTRTQELIDFLLTQRPDVKNPKEMVNFLEAIQKRNPVTVYRFASITDHEFLHGENGTFLTRFEIGENQLIERSGSSSSKHTGRRLSKDDLVQWMIPDEKLEKEAKELSELPVSTEEEKKQLAERVLSKRFLLDNTGSTNIGNCIVDALKQEEGNMVQGVVVFTDGRSTEESAQAYRQLSEMARARKIPVFAVKVGEDRPKVELEVECRGPVQVHPDTTYPVEVLVRAKGMASERVKVFLDIYAPNEDPKKKDAKVLTTKEVDVTLSPREPIQGTEKVIITPEEFGEVSAEGSGSKPPDGKKKYRLGPWYYVARLARDPREIFPNPEHTTRESPTQVLVVDRPMSVLLFTSSAGNHDYQFLRSMLVREWDKTHSVEVSIYAQPAPGLDAPRPNITQDVPPERLLDHFPNVYEAVTPDQGGSGTGASEKWYNLKNYDLIVAFDPDWTNKISPEVLKNVQRWVEAGGGLIEMGGIINTRQLARPGAVHDSLKPINEILPVVLADSVVQDLSRDTKNPWRIKFQPKNLTPEMEFLRLAEENKGSGSAPSTGELYSGWDEFYGDTKGNKQDNPTRGFFNFYPVQVVKKGAQVIATFEDPSVPKLKDGTEMPYMAYHGTVKAGKTFWIGSSEMWRLRMYKEQYLERFWMKLCRFMGSSNMARNNSRITIYMSRRFPEKGVGHIDVQVMDRQLQPLSPTARQPVVTILPPVGMDEEKLKQEIKLQAHPVTEGAGGWSGRDFKVGPRGQSYRVKVMVPDDKELTAETTFDAYPSNPELDNTAPDIKALFYDIASPARDVLASADKEARAEYEQRRRMPGVQKVEIKKDDADKGDDRKNAGGDRLYFDLSNADLIPKLLIHSEKSQINKGEAKDLIYDEHLELRLQTWSIIITAVLGAWMGLVFMMQLLRDSTEHSSWWYLWRALALLPVAVVGFLLTGMLALFGVFSAGEILWLAVIGSTALGCGVIIILQLILNDCKSVSPLWFVWRSAALLVAMGVGFGLWELGTRVPNGAWLSGWLPGAEVSTIVAWFAVIAAVLVWWSLLTLIQITLKEGNDVPPLWFLSRALGHFAVLAVGFCLWALGTVITAQGISTALNVPLTAALIIGALVPIGLLVWFGLQMLRDWRDLTSRWFLVRGAAVAGAIVVGLVIFLIGKWFESSGRFTGLSNWPVLLKPEDALIPVVMMVVVILFCFEWLSRKLLRLA